MTQKMSSRDRELFQRCGEVLHYIWDPIGVAGIPQARDEYDSYVPQVVGRVRSSATPEEIASHLNRIEVDQMGLRANPEGALKTAELLLEWRKWIWETVRA
jgi:hypothetical protein